MGSFVAIAAGVASVALTSCTEEFRSCEETLTCPGNGGGAGDSGTDARGGDASAQGGRGGLSGGSADAGAAGDMSTPLPEFCEEDEDCSDGRWCNGRERCEDQKCVAGEFPCPSPELDGCIAVCEELPGAFECNVAAADADGDGFTSAKCDEEPGEDCDDENEDVRPDAEEVCDDVDNDCDGKIDIEDDLDPAPSDVTEVGNPASSARGVAGLAWLPAQSAFAFAWSSGTSLVHHIYVQTTNADGEVQIPTVEVDTGLTATASVEVGIAAAGKYAGVVWRSGTVGRLRILDPSSSTTLEASPNPRTLTTSATSSLGISPGPREGWLATWRNSMNANGALLVGAGANGTINPATTVGTTTVRYSTANTAEHSILAQYATSEANSRVLILNAPITVEKSISVPGTNHAVAAKEDAFAVAYTTTSGAYVQTFDEQGNEQCASQRAMEAPVKTGTVLRLKRGWLVIATDFRARILYDDCSLGRSFELASFSNADYLRAAGANAGYALVWYDTQLARPYRMFLPPRLCAD